MMFLIYIVGTIDAICHLVGGLGLALVVVSFFILLEEDKEENWCRLKRPIVKKGIFTLICGLLLWMFSVASPDSKTVAAMYLVPKMLDNPKLQNISSKSLDLLNAKLDAWITEIKVDASATESNKDKQKNK